MGKNCFFESSIRVPFVISWPGKIKAARHTEMIEAVLDENPEQVAAYLGGKESLLNWFFGQVMRAAKGQANPQIVREMLNQQLARRK